MLLNRSEYLRIPHNFPIGRKRQMDNKLIGMTYLPVIIQQSIGQAPTKWRELADTYPEAKILLSVRPADRW